MPLAVHSGQQFSTRRSKVIDKAIASELQMSLYIGNFSSRVHQDGLERVFRKFGRCNVQLKDGYGFVVYDFAPNADKALRALRGRNICGEPLTLTWSNRQPKPLQKFSRGEGFYEPRRGRVFGRGDYVNRRILVNTRQDYRLGNGQFERNDGRHNSTESQDEEKIYDQEDVGGSSRGQDGDFDVGTDLEFQPSDGEPDLLDNGRWGEQTHPIPDLNIAQAEIEFDRYDPCQRYDGNNENEDLPIANEGCSAAMQSAQHDLKEEKTGEMHLSHSIDPNLRLSCYNCGSFDHEMSHCPREKPSRSTKYDASEDDLYEGEGDGDGQEWAKSKSYERGWLRRDNALPMKRRHNHKKESVSSRSGRAPFKEEIDEPPRKVLEGGKQNRKDSSNPKGNESKKTRKLDSSTLYDDPDKLQSPPAPKYMPKYSRSRSRASGSLSSFSPMRSGRRSHYSQSRSPRPRSRSSISTSRSLSTSLGQPLASSPDNLMFNQEGFTRNANFHNSSDKLSEHPELVEGGVVLENDKPETTVVVGNDESALSFPKVETNLNSHLALVDGKVDCFVTISSGGTKHSCASQVENHSITERCSPERLREAGGLQNYDPFLMERGDTAGKNSDMVALENSCVGRSSPLSSEEIYKVLKYHGFEVPEESERHVAAESYFGSARMWPWEIIYYRRLRKGPVSIENYARRLSQNREFGITDKYIRSSSGWGELGGLQ